MIPICQTYKTRRATGRSEGRQAFQKKTEKKNWSIRCESRVVDAEKWDKVTYF